MVVRFNNFDAWLPTTLSLILNIHPALATAIIAGEKTETILKIIKATGLLCLNDRSLRDQFRSLIAHLSDLNINRNQYIHTNWLFSEDGSIAQGQKTTRHKKNALHEIIKDVDIEDLKRLSEQIEQGRMNLLKFAKRISKLHRGKVFVVYNDGNRKQKIKKSNT
jgi:hypothetical protein